MEKVMESENFLRSIMRIALPVTVQSMLRASFSIIDQVMIGQLGSASIAGIGLGGKFASIHGVVLGAITATAAIMVSQYMGQKNMRNVRRSFYVNLLAGLLVAAFFTAVSVLCTGQVLSFYTHDVSTRALGMSYLHIYALSFLPAVICAMAETMLCCMEAAVFPLVASIVSLLINTGLNYVLIFGKFGFPSLGVSGAAIGSVVSQLCGCVLVLTFLFIQLRKKGMDLTFDIGFNAQEKKAYLAILAPLLACEFLWSLGENVYSGIYGNIGTDECAAMTMTAPIQCLLTGALCGLSQAAGIMVGKSLGKKDFDRAYGDAKRLLVCGLCASLVLSVLLVVFGRAYTGIFNVEASVQRTSYALLVVFAIVSPVKIQNMILGGGIIRSGGRTKYIMFVDIIGTWCLGVPLGLLAAFVLHLPVQYVYFMLSMEECVRLAVSLVLFRKRVWMHRL